MHSLVNASLCQSVASSGPQHADGTGSVTFPVGQPVTADTLCPLDHLHRPTPTLWQALTEGVDGLHLGCPNASSGALESRTCF